MQSRARQTTKIFYFDYAAATPVSAQVERAMRPYLGRVYGNPSSLHWQGQKARQALEDSRKQVAEVLAARQEEIVFTAGGTESCNLAILGFAKALAGRKAHFITSAIEHPAVLKPFAELEKKGYAVTYLKTSAEGLVSVRELAKAIRPETALVSIMFANNEIGALQPIAEIGKFLFKINFERSKRKHGRIYFHTDACQAAGFYDLSVNRLNVDLLTLNGGKIYGPKQSGVLYAKIGTPLFPLLLGGGQERGLRSGTENVAAAVGLAKALSLARASRKTESVRLAALRDFLAKSLARRVPEIILNGPQLNSGLRLPNNLNLTVPGVEGEALLLYLDAYGICVSTGSACSSNENQPSHVLRAIGVPSRLVKSNLRITLGSGTSRAAIGHLVKIFPRVVRSLKTVVNQVK
ncbi:MAG: cysteine desulfurase [Patescibacteria group bacterium]|nr:cysteine desulfurase [Patescibacteria group bacterium]